MLISLITLATLQMPIDHPQEAIQIPFRTESQIDNPFFESPEPNTTDESNDLNTPTENLFEELSPSHSLARLNDTLRPPTLDEISRGALLQEEHHGEAVEEVKTLLQNLGYETSDNNQYDDSLMQAVGQFQEKYHLTTRDSFYWGKVGPSTLSALRSAARNNYDPDLGEQLAQYARQRMSGYQGSCYRYVALAIHAKTESFLRGYHAYMAADYLAQNRYFSEIEVETEDLKNLPAGAVVVWGKGSSRSGHISIADGKGNEISDHMREQMESHYGGASARVFLPVDPSS